METSHSPLPTAGKASSHSAPKARQLTLHEMPALAEVREDPLAVAALYAEPHTDLTQHFDDEIMDLVEAGDALNDPLYKRWLARSEKLAAEQGIDVPAMRQLLSVNLSAAVDSLDSPGINLPASN